GDALSPPVEAGPAAVAGPSQFLGCAHLAAITKHEPFTLRSLSPDGEVQRVEGAQGMADHAVRAAPQRVRLAVRRVFIPLDEPVPAPQVVGPPDAGDLADGAARSRGRAPPARAGRVLRL